MFGLVLVLDLMVGWVHGWLPWLIVLYNCCRDMVVGHKLLCKSLMKTPPLQIDRNINTKKCTYEVYSENIGKNFFWVSKNFSYVYIRWTILNLYISKFIVYIDIEAICPKSIGTVIGTKKDDVSIYIGLYLNLYHYILLYAF